LFDPTVKPSDGYAKYSISKKMARKYGSAASRSSGLKNAREQFFVTKKPLCEPAFGTFVPHLPLRPVPKKIAPNEKPKIPLTLS
jgi:hypothetical protein